MKIKANANGTSLGMSDKAKIDRMDCAGAAGVSFTAVGLVLTAISYATYMHGTMWISVRDNDTEGRSTICKAYTETEDKLLKE